MADRAYAQPVLPVSPRIATCEANFDVSTPRGLLSSPEDLLVAVRQEILPALSQVLEREEWRDAHLEIPRVEVDLGDWPDEPIWSEVRHVLALKLQEALEAHIQARGQTTTLPSSDRSYEAQPESLTTIDRQTHQSELERQKATSARRSDTLDVESPAGNESQKTTASEIGTSSEPKPRRSGNRSPDSGRKTAPPLPEFTDIPLSPSEAALKLRESANMRELSAFAEWLARTTTTRSTQEILDHFAGQASLRSALLIWHFANEATQQKTLHHPRHQRRSLKSAVARLANSNSTEPQTPIDTIASEIFASDLARHDSARHQAPLSTRNESDFGPDETSVPELSPDFAAVDLVEFLAWLMADPSCSAADRFALNELHRAILNAATSDAVIKANISRLVQAINQTGVEGNVAKAHALRLMARLFSEPRFARLIQNSIFVDAAQINNPNRRDNIDRNEENGTLEASEKANEFADGLRRNHRDAGAVGIGDSSFERAALQEFARRLGREGSIRSSNISATRDALTDIIARQPRKSFNVAEASNHLGLFVDLLNETVVSQAVIFGPSALTTRQLQTLYEQAPHAVRSVLREGTLAQLHSLALNLIPEHASLMRVEAKKLAEHAKDPLSAFRTLVLALLQRQPVDFQSLNQKTEPGQSTNSTAEAFSKRTEPNSPQITQFSRKTHAVQSSVLDSRPPLSQQKRTPTHTTNTDVGRELLGGVPSTTSRSTPENASSVEESDRPTKTPTLPLDDSTAKSKQSSLDGERTTNDGYTVSAQSDSSGANTKSNDARTAEEREPRLTPVKPASASTGANELFQPNEPNAPLKALLALAGFSPAEVDRVMTTRAPQLEHNKRESHSNRAGDSAGEKPKSVSGPNVSELQTPVTDRASSPGRPNSTEQKKGSCATPPKSRQEKRTHYDLSIADQRQTQPTTGEASSKSIDEQAVFLSRSDADLRDRLAELANALDPTRGVDPKDALQLFVSLWPGSRHDHEFGEKRPSDRFPALLARIAAHLTPDPSTLADQISAALPFFEVEPKKQTYGLRAVAARLSALNDAGTADARADLRRAVESLLSPTSTPVDAQKNTEPDKPQQLHTSQFAAEQAEEHSLQVTEIAGLVLFHPYYPMLFDRLKIDRTGNNLHPDHLPIARGALNFLSGTTETEDPLHRVLLGLDAHTPLPEPISLKKDSETLIDGLIRSVVDQWGRLGATSPDGLRETFVRRTGTLRFDETSVLLRVTKGPFDMLLDSLPWSLGPVALPWMPLPCLVSWREGEGG